MTPSLPPECSAVVDVQAEPRPLTRAVTTIPAGTGLWHVGFTNIPFAAYDRRIDCDHRFSPLLRSGSPLGTIYLAETKEVAIAETLWRQLPLRRARLMFERVQSRTIGTVTTARDLLLKELHDPGLRALGLRDENLTHTPSTCYRRTRAYGQALLDDHPDVDGFVWMSRRFNTHRCFMLIANEQIQFTPDSHASLTEPAQRDDFIRLCERAGVAVTLSVASL